jgi:hypothetical protein
MPSWHWWLGVTRRVPGCSVSCEFTPDLKRLPEAAGAVFLGDKELYSRQPQPLPAKPRADILYFAVLREYLALFPERLWARYDGRITYARAPHTAVVCSYARPGALPATAASVPGFHERSLGGDALAAFVSRLCTSGGIPAHDGRARRTKLVQDLQALGADLVDSYGLCAKNRDWPANHDRDKAHVMKTHKFCIAMENNVDPDYVTEKLWDCLAAGAVPVYFGAPNVAEHLPGGRASAIFVEDFATPAALAAHLREVGADEHKWDAYRAWLRTPRDPAWTKLMHDIDPDGAQCRLCEYIARTRAGGARDEL